MSRVEDPDYHQERARSELDLAYRAESHNAAEAHMRLSSLHMRRLQALHAPGPAVIETGAEREVLDDTGIGSPAILAAALFTGPQQRD